MASTTLHQWVSYLNGEDFAYLIQYIENIKNGVPNDKMIILLGPPATGKSTLMNEIRTYLGDDFCGEEYRINELIAEENIKPLIFLPEGILHNTVKYAKHKYNTNRIMVNSIVNFIKFGVSFIIAANDIDTINTQIIENSRIIMMNHQFRNTFKE